jgi:hypothetical protein
MQIPVVRASWTRALATAGVILGLAACRDLPTASPVRVAKTARSAQAPTPTTFVGCRDGMLSSGALWQICLPAAWNGSLIVWAHGYVSPFEPLAIPNDAVGGTPISTIVLGLGFAYATTSYRSNGLAAVDGSRDVEDLLGQFDTEVGTPSLAYLVGASEGSLTSILALERPATNFDGGLAVCGPIGNFRGQLDYFDDFRVLFDYFFPNVLPGDAIDIPQNLIEHWYDVYTPAVVAALVANPVATQQLLSVSHAPIDPSDPNTVGQTVLGILWYNVFGTNEATARLGGNVYDNTTREYAGSLDDVSLNLQVDRFAASPRALAHVKAFETSGRLRRPTVSLHTTGDPIIPIWQQALYQDKVLDVPNAAPFAASPIARYGHCTFTVAEVLAGFAQLVQETTGGTLAVPAALFPNRTAESQFLDLARGRGANPIVSR